MEKLGDTLTILAGIAMASFGGYGLFTDAVYRWTGSSDSAALAIFLGLGTAALFVAGITLLSNRIHRMRENVE